MNKGILLAFLLGAALFSNPAFAAAKNVASTSQKGSLLMYPAINVDPAESTDTLIEISNDENLPVQIECYYVNEKKDRVDFDFVLTAKAIASWDVGTGHGIGAPPFPSSGTYTAPAGFLPTNPHRGELVCFAVDSGVQNQIAFNHLTGTATVYVVGGDLTAAQPFQAFSYNAWAFAAEANTAPPADGTIMGMPGHLVLSGNGSGTYDACPLYNIANFMPGEGATAGSGSSLDAVYTIDNDLTVISCNQDLRQDFQLHLTKLQFTVWNANETSYTGAYACADSVQSVPLNPLDQPLSGGVHDATNFTFPTLRTANARFQVQGVASSQCGPATPALVTENAGLLGVLTSSVGLAGDTLEDAELGRTTHAAGSQEGFVLWDPLGSGPLPQAASHSTMLKAASK